MQQIEVIFAMVSLKDCSPYLEMVFAKERWILEEADKDSYIQAFALLCLKKLGNGS